MSGDVDIETPETITNFTNSEKLVWARLCRDCRKKLQKMDPIQNSLMIDEVKLRLHISDQEAKKLLYFMWLKKL